MSPAGEWWRQRKDFIGHLSAAILDKVQGGTGELNLTRLAWAALQALEERHLFVYLPDGGPAGDALHAAGWDGAPKRNAPGFPDNGQWTVRWEGLRRAP